MRDNICKRDVKYVPEFFYGKLLRKFIRLLILYLNSYIKVCLKGRMKLC